MHKRLSELRVRVLRVRMIANAIRDLVEQYKKDHGVDAEQINAGWCWVFAEDIKAMLPEAELLDNRKMMKVEDIEWDHAFVRIDALYYDSETPYGVADWRHLPCCKQCLEFWSDDDSPTGEEAA